MEMGLLGSYETQVMRWKVSGHICLAIYDRSIDILAQLGYLVPQKYCYMYNTYVSVLYI